MTTATFSVPEIHCGHCKSSIEGTLGPVAGVQEATVDIEGRTVTVSYDQATVDSGRLVELIEEQGYDVDSAAR